MHRTTIMLPVELHRAATARASEQGWSLSELIRHLLEQATQGQGAVDALFADQRRFSGPTDLAVAHDDELYDSEPMALPSVAEGRHAYVPSPAPAPARSRARRPR